ncbi:MAG: saccharopine dehydrogenase NADP-binding domain-containing protein [Candidatus Marinimicrobia bacterium]|nr:saccharopine dehydrogenase NADP-binding domain-containing protein [Candidatus Neomarinimicrobiota bacterium]MBL7109697.1 saccharopine dehydrogenase NADP-binding domain-containing protein [Candidatus Neomarinimicrobiota bacterium]
MKNILVLGAGLVSKPGVTYLLNQENLFVTVASRTVSKAEKLVEGFSNGKAIELNVSDENKLAELIKENDIIISLLPWVHHLKVANLCVDLNKHLATTSYVSEDMQKLDEITKSKGLTFLNEIGVDPGIDHMSAMQIIDEVHDEGGKVLHFYSFCGGLPAPEDNDNPFGYKFSWSPKGVVLASRNSAKFLENDKVVDIIGENLFLNSREEDVEGLGRYEVYPNRDSLPYKDLYGLKDAHTVMRGTYRNLGWCQTLKKIVDLGLVDDSPVDGLQDNTFKQMIAELIGVNENEDVKAKTAEKLELEVNSDVINRFEWLGLFSDEKVTDRDNRLDVLSDRLQEKLYFKDDEKDMIILQHKFIVENKDGSQDKITSTLIDFGIPHGDSSMARTVSLPLAIGVKLMADESITKTGVLIPLTADIYEPVLAELEKLDIKMVEKRTKLK